MTTFSQACDRADQSLLFLRGQLSDAEEIQFQTHIETCEVCRSRLDTAAADADDWGEVSRMLSGFPDDPLNSDGDTGLTCRQTRSSDSAIQAILNALQPTDDPQMLGRLGGYEISGVVGTGGMGTVLKAHDRSLDRIVAIKVLAPHLASTGAARRRFSREARAAAAVLHPNVIAIHGVSNADPLPFLVMPYVRGMSLQRRIDAGGPLPVSELLRIAAQVAAGLAAAHAQGLVHRDIKPANILLEDGVERVTITDFGLARAVDDASMTRSGVIAGTPQYMSPEQARGEVIDVRSDLFSLGSVLYAMSTGHPPFRAETSYGVLHRLTHETARPICQINPEIPDWLSRLVQRLQAKDPEQRFQSAEQVESLLRACLLHCEQPQVYPLPAELQLQMSTRRRLLLAGSAAAGLLLAAIAGSWLTQSPPAVSTSRADRNADPVSDQPASDSSVSGSEQAAWNWPDERSVQELQRDAVQLEADSRLPFQAGPGQDELSAAEADEAASLLPAD